MAQTKLDFDLLTTFIAVVDNGSFTRAAGQVHRSQSAISMQIKRLESQLGQVLFNRQGKALTLTLNGKALVAYARRILNLHDEALVALQKQSQASVLTLGCPDDYVCSLVPKLISLLRAHLPQVKISVISANSGELRQKLDNGELDITILTRAASSNEGVLIYQEKGVWVAKHQQLLQQKPMPLALFEANCKFNSTVIDGLEKCDISYDVLCDTSNIHLLMELVRQEKAISVLPSKAVPDDLQQFTTIEGLPALPVVEVIVSLKAGQQSIQGLSLQEIAHHLA